jgi:hypothetical protein
VVEAMNLSLSFDFFLIFFLVMLKLNYS